MNEELQMFPPNPNGTLVEIPMTDDDRIAALEMKVDRLCEIVGAQVQLLGMIQGEIAPVLSMLENNPMFKMMFGRKGDDK